jgi:hypothetical protein
MYKIIDLKSDNVDSMTTEIMFEVAGARADRNELVRLNIKSDEMKMYDSVLRLLKGMKQKGLIQFFATEKSFADGSTEASFLINKYQDIISFTDNNGGEVPFIIVKI